MNRHTGLRVPYRPSCGSSAASAGSASCETPWPGRTIRSSVAYPFVDARLIESGGRLRGDGLLGLGPFDDSLDRPLALVPLDAFAPQPPYSDGFRDPPLFRLAWYGHRVGSGNSNAQGPENMWHSALPSHPFI